MAWDCVQPLQRKDFNTGWLCLNFCTYLDFGGPPRSLFPSIVRLDEDVLLRLSSTAEAYNRQSTTVVVDGVSEWKNPSVHVGDSIVFRPKYWYDLYIFRNQHSFNRCNFTEATILSNSSTTYTWYASRPGTFYFTFHNDTLDSCNQDTRKLPIKVFPKASPPTPAEFPPEEAPLPSPVAGGVVPSSPAYPWPFQPHEKASSPAPLPSSSSPTNGPDRSDGMPFINSNPAVPLPTGEVDSATIRPLPANGHERQVATELLGLRVVTILLSVSTLLRQLLYEKYISE